MHSESHAATMRGSLHVWGKLMFGWFRKKKLPLYRPEDYVLGEDVTHLFDVRKQRIAEADTGPMATVIEPPRPASEIPRHVIRK